MRPSDQATEGKISSAQQFRREVKISSAQQFRGETFKISSAQQFIWESRRSFSPLSRRARARAQLQLRSSHMLLSWICPKPLLKISRSLKISLNEIEILRERETKKIREGEGGEREREIFCLSYGSLSFRELLRSRDLEVKCATRLRNRPRSRLSTTQLELSA